MTDERNDLLDLMGYRPEWLEYGLVSEAFLRRQADEFAASDDRNTEHYRYAAFRSVLAGRAFLSDEELARYVGLARLDADVSMAGSALADLIRWHGLTGEQFERLSAHPAISADFLQIGISRMRLMDRLRGGPLTDSLFEDCLASGDSVTQRLMLETSSIDRRQVERLAEGGASRAVRNMAAAMLRRRGTDT